MWYVLEPAPFGLYLSLACVVGGGRRRCRGCWRLAWGCLSPGRPLSRHTADAFARLNQAEKKNCSLFNTSLMFLGLNRQ